MHKRKRTTPLILLAVSLTTGCNKIPQLQQGRETPSSASNYSPCTETKVPSDFSYVALKEVPCSNTVLALGRNRVSTSYDNIVASLREASPDNSITKLKEVLAFLEVLYQNRTTPALDDLSVRDLNAFANLLYDLVEFTLHKENNIVEAAQMITEAYKSKALPYFEIGKRAKKGLFSKKSDEKRNIMLIGAFATRIIRCTILLVVRKKILSFKAMNYPVKVNRLSKERILAKSKSVQGTATWMIADILVIFDETYRNRFYLREAPFFTSNYKGKKVTCCVCLSKKL